MKRLTFARRLTAALALVLATSAFAILAPAAHAAPSQDLVTTGTTLEYVFDYNGSQYKLTVDVTGKNGNTDDVDVTIEYDGTVVASGSGTMKELPSFFALDCSLYASLSGTKILFMGQIYRSSGEGSGKLKADGTYVWYHWRTLGFYD